jgi:hypothetical protein
MTHRLYRGEANVLREDVATWEAAGWVADDHSPIRPVSDMHAHVPANFENDRKPAKAKTSEPIENKEPEE